MTVIPRLTERMMSSELSANMMKNKSKMWQLQKEISSGEKVVNITDDPGLHSRIAALEDTSQKTNDYLTNINTVRNELETYESLIDGVYNQISDLKTMVLRAGNSDVYDTNKETFRQQTENILESLVMLGNEKVSGRYVFSGSEVLTKPFETVSDGTKIIDVVYNGDNAPRSINLDANDKFLMNLSGENVFKGQAGSNDDIFGEIISMRDDMTDSKFENIDDHIAALDSLMDRLLIKRTEIGTNVEHANNMETFLQQFQIGISEQESDMRYTDMAGAISELANMEFIYEATLQVSARINRLSIMDYM